MGLSQAEISNSGFVTEQSETLDTDPILVQHLSFGITQLLMLKSDLKALGLDLPRAPGTKVDPENEIKTHQKRHSFRYLWPGPKSNGDPNLTRLRDESRCAARRRRALSHFILSPQICHGI
jgi:hypothetical protein